MKRLVWFRGKDLRVHDHQPLSDARNAAACVFVLDPFFFSAQRARRISNRMAFLLESLVELKSSIEALGGELLVVEGRSTEVIPQLAEQLGVDEVVAYRWTEPFGRKRDHRVADALGVPLRLYEGETLLPPGSLRTKAGGPFRVFTPFYRAFQRTFEPTVPSSKPVKIRSIRSNMEVRTVPIPEPGSLGLRQSPGRVRGGEAAACDRLDRFISERLNGYSTGREIMGLPGTSRISQDIKFGTLSVRTVWHRVASSGLNAVDVESFCRELGWREFTHSCLWDTPELLDRPFRPQWANFPWAVNPDGWARWKSGHTGYPIVDAASRELLQTGFVHNRARMIAASFLTKHLRISYRCGEVHYLAHLTDGDWAQNNAGWQWAAGCGCDAQPYFRVFNPVLQGKRFDPNGAYVRKYVPELAGLQDRDIHAPWEAPSERLLAAGVTLGQDYPNPIVVHAEARELFLALARAHVKA
jgi:deoxyribodipyrimidine photo-lyase